MYTVKMWRMEKIGECVHHPYIYHFSVSNVTDVNKLIYGLYLFSIYFIS